MSSEIIKRELNRNFTIISNEIFKNKNISLKAKGLHTLIMSLSDDWDFSISGIEQIIKENNYSIRSTINELIKFGYVNRERIYEDKKLSGIHYTFFQQSLLVKKVNQDNLNQDNLNQDNLNQDNSPQLNTVEELNTKKRRKKEPLSFLKEDFIPSESIIKAIIEKNPNLDKTWLDNEFIRFKNYHIGKNSKWSDWNRSWYNWVDGSKTKVFIEKNNTSSASPGSPPKVSGVEYVKDSDGKETTIEKFARNEDGTINYKKLSKKCLSYIKQFRNTIIQRAYMRKYANKEKLTESDALLLELDYEKYCEEWENRQVELKKLKLMQKKKPDDSLAF